LGADDTIITCMNVETSPEPQVKRKSLLRRLIRYSVIALVILFAVVFFARRQIGDALAKKLDERLVAAGIYVSWESAAWVPGPGIRLKDVALFKDAAHRNRLALLGNVTALKGDGGWDRVGVKMEKADLVLGTGEGETKLEKLDLDLLILPGKAELIQLQGMLNGLKVDVAGTYMRSASPATAEPAPSVARAAGRGLFDDVNLEGLKVLKQWVNFQSKGAPPALKVAFQSQPDGSRLELSTTLDGKAFQWRGLNWDVMQVAARTSVTETVAPVQIEMVRIGHAGRTCEFTGAFDSRAGIMRVAHFDSSLDLLALARAFAPEVAETLKPLATTGVWSIQGSGEIPAAAPVKTTWKGGVTLDGELAYASGGMKVALQKPGFTLDVKDGEVVIRGFKAGLWNGALNLPETRLNLPDGSAKPQFQTQVTLSDARLEAVMSGFGTSLGMPGVVHLDWKGAGGFDLPSIKGGGTLAIHQAEFYRIPLLGPLHLVFDKLTPGFGRDVASTLTASHRISDNVFFVNDMKLESKFTRIDADGTVNLASQYAKMAANAKLQGIIGLSTALLSALLEVEGEGPVSDVKWKLKNIPGMEMIGGAAKAAGQTGEVVLDGATSVVKGTAGVATEAVKDTGKAVRGILNLPGKLIPGKK
jgi:hypothetical protein